MNSELTYQEVKEVAVAYYSSLEPLFCPALNDHIHFTFSEGFHHIIHKNKRNPRTQKEQMLRFKLLKRGVALIGLTTTYQEYEERTASYVVKLHKVKTMKYKHTQYWGLIAIIDNRKIKVVLRKVGNGNIQFWSIIPSWYTSTKRDTKFISTMKGDPEMD